MSEITQLDAWLAGSTMDGESKGCRYPIAVDSVLVGASIQILSPYVVDGEMASVSDVRARMVDIRDSYVEGAKTDSDVVIPFDIVDEPALGNGAFYLPSHDLDGHICDVYVPIADNRTMLIYFGNGEDQEELKIPDPELACRSALSVAASLKD